MATKGTREKIKLESTAGTGHFYTTSKNKKTMPEKMLIKKFDPKARKHVDYAVQNGVRVRLWQRATCTRNRARPQCHCFLPVGTRPAVHR